jgi:hypothetical protein
MYSLTMSSRKGGYYTRIIMTAWQRQMEAVLVPEVLVPLETLGDDS